MFNRTAKTEVTQRQRILRRIRTFLICLCALIAVLYLIPPIRDAMLPTLRNVMGPVLTISWSSLQAFNYLPQPVVWILLVMACAVAFGAALYFVPSIQTTDIDYNIDLGGPLGSWQQHFDNSGRGTYSEWRLASAVATLVVDTVAQHEQISINDAKKYIANAKLDLPKDVQARLNAGLARSRNAKANLSEADIATITAYLDTLY